MGRKKTIFLSIALASVILEGICHANGIVAVSRNIKNETYTFEIDGRTRVYLLHLPENLPDNSPLVFVLHGYGGTAKEMMNYCGMNRVADENGFAVCYPQGNKGPDNKNSWNAGYSNPTVNDVKFLSSLAKYLQKENKLSSKNTFCTGMSNGADMCYVLACQSRDIFSAIAPVAGCMMNSTFNSCNPLNPVPVFEMHGTDDPITLWDGDADYSEEYGGYKSVSETCNFWCDRNNCTTTIIDTLPKNIPMDKKYIIMEKHLKGINNNEVWLYSFVGGKHDWPGSLESNNIIASEEIWNFFKRFIKNR